MTQIAYFPYIKTSSPVRYRELTVHPSEDPGDIGEDISKHIDRLNRVFYLRDNFRIDRMCCVVLDNSEDPAEEQKFIHQLQEFQTLVAYVYGSPHKLTGDPFLRTEHATVYRFEPGKVPVIGVTETVNVERIDDEPGPETGELDHSEEMDGYVVHCNEQRSFHITEGSRIYPPVSQPWLNIAQDLSADLQRKSQRNPEGAIFRRYQRRGEISEVDARVLTALQWYNRSCSLQVTEEEALVLLAIAFECLLDLEQGPNVTDRFREAVQLLVGGVPRLNSWLDQFYKARSKIVHEGRADQLLHFRVDTGIGDSSESRYRSLISYGRRIFRVCVPTVLTGSRLAERYELSPMLVTNQERLVRICKKLGDAEGDPAEALWGVAEDIEYLEDFRWVAEEGLTVRQLLGTTKIVMRAYHDSNPDLSQQTLDLAAEIANVDVDDELKALGLVKDVRDRLHADRPTTNSTASDSQKLFRLIRSFIDTVWHYTFMYYYSLLEKPGDGAD